MELVLSLFNDASIATVAVQEYLYLYVEFNGAVNNYESDGHYWQCDSE
jgi:hypothetical protein